MKELLHISGLTKRYKENLAVNDISFRVYQGEILCVLGPNGAGKSSTIHMITGALAADSGRILASFCGGWEIHKSLNHFKRSLGIVPQDLAIYEDLSAWENVEFFASLYGLRGSGLKEGIRFALDLVGLSEHAGEKAKTFSGGMKRRLNIACAIAHKPELLVMDEPTVGIDPQSRNHILESIRRLRDEGMTIIYTTHYMEEVEAISTRILILDHGRIIAEGTKEQLKERVEADQMIQIEADGLDDFDTDLLFRIEGVKNVKIGDKLELTVIRSIDNLDRIISVLIQQGKKINRITTQPLSLETVFLDLTGRPLRD